MHATTTGEAPVKEIIDGAKVRRESRSEFTRVLYTNMRTIAENGEDSETQWKKDPPQRAESERCATL
ncbi:MAG: hypothetical protein R3F11_20575 [Verrucomicrobiales bacterium]